MLTGAVSDHNLLTDLTLGQLLAMIGTLAVIIGLVRKIGPILHRLNNLLDDWFGEEERPGVKKRAGVMERLSEQDDVMTEQSEVLSKLRKKVEPLVDDTAEGNHQEVLHKLDEIGGVTRGHAAHLSRVEQLLHRHIRESKALMVEVKEVAAANHVEIPPWPDMPDGDDPESHHN